MIFAKNPVRGKVKTRLARTLGKDKALRIYKYLLAYTLDEAQKTNCDKAVFYSEFIDRQDMCEKNGHQQYVQQGDDLGKRMENAFYTAFSSHYKKVLIIGSDCFELTHDIMEQAMFHLDSHDVVVGPATDGGYYLLGMKAMHREFFMNKQWSSENVLFDTAKDMEQLGLSFKLLNTLTDIDEEKEFVKSGIEL